MDTESPRQKDTVWGNPPVAPHPWGNRKTVLAFGIAAVIAALGGASIYAATGQSSQFMGPPGMHGSGPSGPPNGASVPRGFLSQTGPGAHGVGNGPPLHGQVVVSDGMGGYLTVLSQTGVVTAVTPDSVTVHSVDGFTQNWVVSAGQESAFALDDTVMIRGEQAAGEPTPKLTQVLDPLRTPH